MESRRSDHFLTVHLHHLRVNIRSKHGMRPTRFVVHIRRGYVPIFLPTLNQVSHFLQRSHVLLRSILQVGLPFLVLSNLKFLLAQLIQQVENSFVVDLDVATTHFKFYVVGFFEKLLVV